VGIVAEHIPSHGQKTKGHNSGKARGFSKYFHKHEILYL